MKLKEWFSSLPRKADETRQYCNKHDIYTVYPSGWSWVYYGTCIASYNAEASTLKLKALGYSKSTSSRHSMIALQYQVYKEYLEAKNNALEVLTVQV